MPDVTLLPLPPGWVGILWASWHIVSVFGMAFAAILFAGAHEPLVRPNAPFILAAITFANLGASTLVFVGTRGRHPGWIALLAIAVLIGVASLGG